MIRLATPQDAPALAALCTQLGYGASEDDVRARVRARTDGAIGVFESGGRVIGWIEVQRRTSLEAGDIGEITGLVVDVSARGSGAGRGLVDWAKNWAAARGLARLRVRTNEVRQTTHAFYEGQGFTLTKSQRVYDVDLQGPQP